VRYWAENEGGGTVGTLEDLKRILMRQGSFRYATQFFLGAGGGSGSTSRPPVDRRIIIYLVGLVVVCAAVPCRSRPL